MKDNGTMINSTAKAPKLGRTGPTTKGTMLTVRKKEMALSTGQMGLASEESSLIITFKAREPILGQTVGSSLAIGSSIKCTEVVYLLGKMGASTLENMWKTKKVVMEFSTGPMAASMTEHGLMENNMAKELTLLVMGLSRQGFGQMGSELSG